MKKISLSLLSFCVLVTSVFALPVPPAAGTEASTTTPTVKAVPTSPAATEVPGLLVPAEATTIVAPVATPQNAAGSAVTPSAKESRKAERTASQLKKLMDKPAGNAKQVKKPGFFQRVKAFKAIKNFLGAMGNQIAAILLCFFFGGLGIHRVVMGGKGILILWYFLTCGGIFGILPLIDFIMLIVDPARYEGNNKFIAF